MSDPLKQALAVNGGPPLRTTPWPARSLLGEEERAAVNALFDQAIEAGAAIGYNGETERAYCAEFAEFMGGGYADAVNSGTTAVYVALKALDLPAFSEVIVSPVTDPGGLMPVPLLNLVPAIADAAPGCYNTSAEEIAKVITPLTSAIVVAHIAGEPVDMEAVMALAREHDLKVVEDVAQAHGAKLNDQYLGTFGDLAAISTMFGKHHCTGGQGGVVFTRNEDYYWAARCASDRGKANDGKPTSNGNLIASLNLNLNDLAAAIGREQLKKLPGIVSRRRRSALALRDGLADHPFLAIPDEIPGAEASYWFVRVRFDVDAAPCDKATFCAALGAETLSVGTTYAALPHTFEWFVQRRVFGDSGYPWGSPLYQGDRDRQFPTPQAQQAVATHFNLYPHESWGSQEVADALAIIDKVTKAYQA